MFGTGAEALGCSRVLLQRVSARGARVYVGGAGGSTQSGTLAPPPALLGGVPGLGGHSHPAATGSGTVSVELWEMEVSFLFVVREAKPFVPL